MNKLSIFAKIIYILLCFHVTKSSLAQTQFWGVGGSTITNLCGQTWQGIQVWGNTELLQMPQFQGVIALNGATIEYAKNAISPWEVGNFPVGDTSGGTGGLIFANKTTFRNNWRSVDFMKYANTANIFTTALVSEKSFFKGCTFTVDTNYRNFGNNTGLLFLGHISMWGVGGTQIQGCTFKDERTNKLGNQSVGGSYGIYTLDASPLITSLPLGTTFPATSFLENRFEGLERAVDIGSPGPVWKAVVDGATFLNNEQGVTIRAHSGAKVIRNNFQIGGFDTQGSSTSFVQEYGLGLIGTMSGFSVEQNTFESTNVTDVLMGSWVEGVGDGGNMIRNNNYLNLTGANVAHGDNDGFLPQDGLQYRCNQNQGNTLDFVVFPNPNTGNAITNLGLNQGFSNGASRNTLTPTANWQVINLGSQNLINYWHSTQPFETPDTTKILRVQRLQGTFGANDCNDIYTNPSFVQAAKQNGNLFSLNQLKQKYYNAANDYAQLLQTYNDFLDKGNSAALQAEITNVLPQHKNRLKDTLMSISPYLTRETVLVLAAAGHYNRVKLKEIIMENPNVIIDEAFIDTLASLNTPLNSNDLATLAASPKDKLKEPKRTFKRSKLESRLAEKYQEIFFWANEVIFAYSNDTLGGNPDSIKVWIQNKPGLSAQYELVEHFWSQKQYQDAINLIQSLPLSYKMEARASENNKQYAKLKNILYLVYQKGRTEATLERNEVTDLKIIANLKVGTASIQAANILQFFYGINGAYYPALPNLGAPRSNRLETATDSLELGVTPTIWGYPNPAINWMDIQYDFNQDNLSGENKLVVTSTAGQMIQIIDLQNNSGIVQLNTTDWAGGIYFATLFSNKTRGTVYKFVVRK